VLVTYSYDANAILLRPLHSKRGAELLETIKEVHSYLSERGYNPKHQFLDNEASTALKSHLKASLETFQLVLPHLHRKNAAERAIWIFKNHFVSILCGVHQKFPLYLWYKLLEQVKMTMNMVRPCRTNPKLSAYESLEGVFSYNHTPLAPLGAQVIVHDGPTTRSSWAPHGHHAWLIGPAKDHYRCFTVFNPSTKSTTIANQFHWAESNRFTTPKISPKEQLVDAANNLSEVIRNNRPVLLPDDKLNSKIDELCTIFQKATDNLFTRKPSPISKETPVTLSKLNPDKPPRGNIQDTHLSKKHESAQPFYHPVMNLRR